MKLKPTVALAVLLAAGWGTQALAQGAATGTGLQPGTQNSAGTAGSGAGMGTGSSRAMTGSRGSSSESTASQQSGQVYNSDTIIGAEVRDPSGDRLGKIDQLLLQPDGNVQSAVIEKGGGGFFGSSQRVTLPWNQLKIAGQNGNLTITAERDTFARAPSYDEGQAEASGSMGNTGSNMGNTGSDTGNNP